MSLVKFMTIFDDEAHQVFAWDRQKIFDISTYPSMYFCDGKPFYDTINTNSQIYSVDLCSNKSVTAPIVPASIFEYEFERAYNNGYFGVIIVLPHFKWTDYRHQAEIAKKRFLRKNEIDEQGFEIKFINSKGFAAGTLYKAYELASLYSSFHSSVDDFIWYIRSFNLKRVSLILSYGKNTFCQKDDYSANMIVNNTLIPLNFSQYPESVIFDKFADAVCDEIKRYNNKYLVSAGCDCAFLGNVLGRIEMHADKMPECIIQYGIPTASVIGTNAVCISIV